MAVATEAAINAPIDQARKSKQEEADEIID